MYLTRTHDTILVDRAALAYLTGRSVNTIRKHCVVVKRRGAIPLYDLFEAERTLASVSTRAVQPESGSKKDWTNTKFSI